MIGFMLTSLNVVSMAVEFFASSRRSATRLRRRVIGTRFSETIAQLRRRRDCRGGGWRLACRRRGFRQMFLNVFASQTAADASAFDGRWWVEVVFSQQTTDRRAQRVVVLLQRSSRTLRRRGRLRIGFFALSYLRCYRAGRPRDLARQGR